MIADLLHTRHEQRGDTIIEVLIAIAVASIVLAVTYSTMNRNLLITRDSQERTEATKIAQGQIELLKGFRDGGNTAPPGAFCLSPTSPTPIQGFTGLPAASLPDDFSRYPPSNGCNSGFYYYAIVADAAVPGTYRFYVRWNRVGGTGQDQIIMVYRI